MDGEPEKQLWTDVLSRKPECYPLPARPLAAESAANLPEFRAETEYLAMVVAEYWVFDRFRRMMRV